MSYKSISLFVILLLAGCSNNPTQKQTTQYNIQPDTSKSDDKLLGDVLDSTTTKEKGTYTYQYQNKAIIQTLVVTYTKRGQIAFDLTSSNKRLNKTSHVKGIANMLELNGDYETDDDDEGNAYSAKEYIYQTDDCNIAIRIDVDEYNLVQIPNTKTFCNITDQDCPFFSVGILKKIKYSAAK